MKIYKLKILGIIWIIIIDSILGCQKEHKSINFPYHAKYEEFKSVKISPSWCVPLSSHVCILSDDSGQIIYKDTIRDLGCLFLANCLLYSSNDNTLSAKIENYAVSSKIEDLLRVPIIDNAFRDFENNERFNQMLKNNLKIRKMISDSSEIEFLTKLIIDTQFSDYRKCIKSSNRKDWIDVQKKYSEENVAFHDQFSHTIAITKSAWKEINEVSFRINKNELLLAFSDLFCEEYNSYFISNDPIIKFKFYLDQDGFFQIQKKIATPQVILLPRSYE